MTKQFRVCVIGGGVVGASLLYHLAERGWTDCILIERDELTSGSTWHAAGNGGTWAGSSLVTRFQKYSIELYRSLGTAGKAVGMHQPGSITVSRNPDRLIDFEKQLGIGLTLGLKYEVLGPEACEARIPLMRTDDIVGGIWDPLHSHFDPSSVTNALATSARERGSKILRKTKVTGLTKRRKVGWVVHTTKGDIRTEQVVNCGGMWAPEIARLAGGDLPIVPMLHQYAVTEVIDAIVKLPSELPIIRDREGSFYLRQERQGLLVGPYERRPLAWNPYGIPPEFGRDLLPPDLDRIEEGILAAIHRVPCLADAGITRVVHGPIPYTPDERPLIGPMLGVRDMWLCTGTAIGIIQAGGMGRFLAEWIVEGETEWDPLAVHPGRFGDYATKEYTIAKAVESYAEHYEQIPYPGLETHAVRKVRTSAVYDDHKADGAVFGTSNGWERPVWFAPKGVEAADSWGFKRPASFRFVGEEHRACREAVALFDITTFAKYELTGPAAKTAVEYLFTSRAPRPGRALVTLMCSPRGGIMGDFAVAALPENRFYIVGAGSGEGLHHDWMMRHLPKGCSLQRQTTSLGVLHIAGPNARALLGELVTDEVSNEVFPFLAIKDLDFGVCRARTIRVSFSGDLGYEIHVPTEYHRALYERIKTKGKAHGLRLAGSRALAALRIEKGFLFWGSDLTTEVNPYQAGLGFMVNLQKGEFIGQPRLAELEQTPLAHREVLVEVDTSDEDCIGGEAILAGDTLIGQVTSGAYGHWVGKSLAIAWLQADHADAGCEFEVLLYGKGKRAQVLREPPFDADDKRSRG